MRIEEWLDNNELGINIWKNKYQRNNETLDEWFRRVSGGNLAIETYIREKKFLFGGRILSNRGITEDEKVTYSNCYVIAPPEDSIESIYDSRKKLARTYSYGGGCGIDISQLAPAGARVRNQAKETSGAVSFMQGYSGTTEEIGQNGRRGALMISIDCTHPDLLEFIDIKTTSEAVTQANISVKVNDNFMRAVINDEDWELSFERKETGEKISKIVKAKEVFHKLCENNWKWAEPGILYWDTIERYNMLNTTPDFKYAGVNPCAEEPLPAGGSCLLGSLNLSEFVKYPFTDRAYFDLEEFNDATRTAVIAMNEVLDEGLELHPLIEQRESVRKWRQIGLGIMGLADTFIKLGLTYGSEFANHLLSKIGETLSAAAINESTRLAIKYEAYPGYMPAVKESEFITSLNLQSHITKKGLYNSQLLTCAPTGSISTMLGISGGIEPLFALSWQRKTESLHKETVYYTEYPKIIKELKEALNIKDDKDLPEYVVTAYDIAPLDRVKTQATLQKYIDASISSTVNLPNSATIEDVENIYIEAWKQGLKGITIYRQGSDKGAILSTENKKEETSSSPEEKIKEGPKRGEVVAVDDSKALGFKRKLMTGCGSLHCTAFFDLDSGELVETYLSKGSTGGCNNFMIGLSRMISMSARAGVPINDIVDQLMSTGSCPSYATRTAIKHDTSKGSCCPMAVGYALKEMYEEFQGREMKPKQQKKISQTKEKQVPCPECGEPLIFEGGCNLCRSCGWTKCE